MAFHVAAHVTYYFCPCFIGAVAWAHLTSRKQVEYLRSIAVSVSDTMIVFHREAFLKNSSFEIMPLAKEERITPQREVDLGLSAGLIQ